MKERRNRERRKWGRKITYPFIDSDGVLVTKNRRRQVDRRFEEKEKPEEQEQNEPQDQPALAKSNEKNQSSALELSESKLMELDDAIQDDSDTGPVSKLDDSIKELESQILEVTSDIESDEHVEVGEAESQNKNIATPEAEEKDNITSIELVCNGTSHVFTENDTSCIVGRDPKSDFPVDGKFVSRSHAEIVYKDGKFLLLDKSYNGTYIKFENGQKIHVSKNEQTLIANGVMSMGEPVKDKSNPHCLIEFKVL